MLHENHFQHDTHKNKRGYKRKAVLDSQREAVQGDKILFHERLKAARPTGDEITVSTVAQRRRSGSDAPISPISSLQCLMSLFGVIWNHEGD